MKALRVRSHKISLRLSNVNWRRFKELLLWEICLPRPP